MSELAKFYRKNLSICESSKKNMVCQQKKIYEVIAKIYLIFIVSCGSDRDSNRSTIMHQWTSYVTTMPDF